MKSCCLRVGPRPRMGLLSWKRLQLDQGPIGIMPSDMRLSPVTRPLCSPAGSPAGWTKVQLQAVLGPHTDSADNMNATVAGRAAREEHQWLVAIAFRGRPQMRQH